MSCNIPICFLCVWDLKRRDTKQRAKICRLLVQKKLAKRKNVTVLKFPDIDSVLLEMHKSMYSTKRTAINPSKFRIF